MFPSNLQKENKKIIEFSYFLKRSKKEERREERIFKIFRKREREKRDNYYQPQKKRSKTKKKREEMEAKVRNVSVIGLCIFHTETFRRRSERNRKRKE